MQNYKKKSTVQTEMKKIFAFLCHRTKKMCNFATDLNKKERLTMKDFFKYVMALL